MDNVQVFQFKVRNGAPHRRCDSRRAGTLYFESKPRPSSYYQEVNLRSAMGCPEKAKEYIVFTFLFHSDKFYIVSLPLHCLEVGPLQTVGPGLVLQVAF